MRLGKQPGNGMSMTGKKAVIGLAAAIAMVAAVFGSGGKNQTEMGTKESPVESTVQLVQEELPVSDVEEALLSTLYGTMVNRSYAETARILNENEAALTKLLSETLDNEKYCYWEVDDGTGTMIRMMEPLGVSEDRSGMVLTRYNTVFYGDFANGKPEGECHAIQAMVLNEQPRYTFAEGMWKNGKMHGEGTTGYHYYLHAPNGGFVMTEKIGTYVENLLNGTFLYRTESILGEKLSWEIEAENGVTILNDDWKPYPLLKQYMLGAKEDPSRAYVLTEERAGALIWNNLIIWDESGAENSEKQGNKV